MRIIYIFSFMLAFCALLYELLIARVVSLWAVNNGIWYAMAVGIFIGGMGVGAWLSNRWGKEDQIWQKLLSVECWLSIVGGFSVLGIYSVALVSLFWEVQGHVIAAKMLFFGGAFITASAVGICAGMELPLLLAMADKTAGGSSHKRVAKVLLMDYAGALAAGLIFALWIIPVMSVMSAVILVGILNAAVAGGVAYYYGGVSDRMKAGLLLLGLSIFLVLSPWLDEYFIAKYYFSFQDEVSFGSFFKPKDYPGRVERIRSAYQQIDLVTADDIGPEARGLSAAYIQPVVDDNKGLEGTVLFLNNDFQFAVSFERIYHEAFVHIPMSVLEVLPGRVLILGGGDGLLLREVLKYPEVREVVLVDIDPKVIDMFRNKKSLAQLNDHAFQDPRVRVIVADAYQYARRSSEMFDMVFCDFPNPDDYDLAKLYSREFYVFVRSRLKENGLLVIDAPGLESVEQGREAERTIGKVLGSTLYASGFKAIRPFFSRLEENNPTALKALGEDASMLRGYLEGLRSGFIMACVNQCSFTAKPLQVQGLRVMNDERVRLGLNEGDSLMGLIEGSSVNSIVRPLFPLKEEWSRIRTAY